MDECHITLFDPWFRRGIRDRLLGILGTSQLQRFKRKKKKQPQRSSIVHKSKLPNIVFIVFIQMDSNPSTLAPLSTLLVGLSAASRYIHKYISRSNTPSLPSNLLIYQEMVDIPGIASCP